MKLGVLSGGGGRGGGMGGKKLLLQIETGSWVKFQSTELNKHKNRRNSRQQTAETKQKAIDNNEHTTEIRSSGGKGVDSFNKTRPYCRPSPAEKKGGGTKRNTFARDDWVCMK
jgi:hypothetical protein